MTNDTPDQYAQKPTTWYFDADAQPESLLPNGELISLRDWFAGNLDVTAEIKRLLDYETPIAQSLVPYPKPQDGTTYVQDVLARYRWQCEVEAALRYMKADAMMKAR